MNNWQKIYCDTYFNGKMPRSKEGKADYELLGKVKSQVTVDYPDFNGLRGFVPAHTVTYIVTENETDMPNGKISVISLVSDLPFWFSRGYKVTTR